MGEATFGASALGASGSRDEGTEGSVASGGGAKLGAELGASPDGAESVVELGGVMGLAPRERVLGRAVGVVRRALGSDDGVTVMDADAAVEALGVAGSGVLSSFGVGTADGALEWTSLALVVVVDDVAFPLAPKNAPTMTAAMPPTTTKNAPALRAPLGRGSSVARRLVGGLVGNVIGDVEGTRARRYTTGAGGNVLATCAYAIGGAAIVGIAASWSADCDTGRMGIGGVWCLGAAANGDIERGVAAGIAARECAEGGSEWGALRGTCLAVAQGPRATCIDAEECAAGIRAEEWDDTGVAIGADESPGSMGSVTGAGGTTGALWSATTVSRSCTETCESSVGGSAFATRTFPERGSGDRGGATGKAPLATLCSMRRISPATGAHAPLGSVGAPDIVRSRESAASSSRQSA